jgi:hypothetical protein
MVMIIWNKKDLLKEEVVSYFKLIDEALNRRGSLVDREQSELYGVAVQDEDGFLSQEFAGHIFLCPGPKRPSSRDLVLAVARQPQGLHLPLQRVPSHAQ